MAVLAQLQHGSNAAQKWPVISGKMYSTMALPIDTKGLPVHINGPFRMSADRRKLWEGQGDRGQGAQNRAVLKDIIAPAWAGALSSLIHNRSTTQAPVVNRLWPGDQTFQPTLLGQSATAVATCLIANNSALVWVPEADKPSSTAGRWVSVRQACFLPESQEPDSCVIRVGRRAGLAVPEMPLSTLRAVKAAAENAGLPLCIFSPALLRRALRCAGNIVNADETEQVLSYAISDNQLRDLHNLYLICLAGQPVVVQQIKVVDIAGSRSQAGKTYFIPDAQRKVYKLMAFGRQSLQMAPSESWSKLLKLPDAAESRTSSSKVSFNVRHPTLLDLANSLPAAWEQPICDCIDDSGIAHPGHTWLKHFWAVTSSDWDAIPEELLHFALVPIHGNRLASPAYCRCTAALSTHHMAGLPPNSAQVLSAVGCLCITLSGAACASPVASTDNPITTALAAVSADAAVPLSQLVSPDRLGTDIFHQLRNLLARHMQASEAQRSAVWAVLRQCCIFEDFTGAFTDLPSSWLGIDSALQLLPNAAWEERWAEVDTKLPFAAVKYHTASVMQRNLLQHSGLRPPTLPAFLRDSLLPGIMDSSDVTAEPLLLQALQEIHDFPADWHRVPAQVFVDGALKRLSYVMDSSSELLTTLYTATGPRSLRGCGLCLLPSPYADGQRLAVLKQQGLMHEDVPYIYILLACAHSLAELAPYMTKAQQQACSTALVDMLRRNIDTYTQAALRTTEASIQRPMFRAQLICCEIFATAELELPHRTSHFRPFTSLASSSDYAHFSLVATAIPVTNRVLGDTNVLRRKLQLPTAPQLVHVVRHLLNTSGSHHIKALLKQGHATQQLLADIQQAYRCIFAKVETYMTQGKTAEHAFKVATELLREQPWVLVQGRHFVLPKQLCFDLEADTDNGFCVPQMLLEMLHNRPGARQWLVKALGAVDLPSNAPPVKQLHLNPVTAEIRMSDYLGAAFNDPSQYTNGVIVADGQEIHVHKMILAEACQVFADHWTQTDQPFVVDIACPVTAIRVSYASALVFFAFLYTGEVRWPTGQADAATAMEILILAKTYGVAFLLCDMEVALQPTVEFGTCCQLLSLADFYDATQLRAYCLHFVRTGRRYIVNTARYQQLSQALQSLVEG